MILIDNGHGRETPGKCSPDGRLREWYYNRKLARELSTYLDAAGIGNRIIVPEDTDVALKERIARVNRIAASEPCVLVSLHVNAAGMGGWHNARGFSAFVSPKGSEVSRRLAAALTEAMRRAGYGGNRAVNRQGYIERNLAVLNRSRCPAVLTENLFMDNREDLEFLLQDDTPGKLAAVHACVIEKLIGQGVSV